MPKNFAYSLVATAPSPAISGTSLVVTAGDGAKFPADSFRATIWPINARPTTANAEVVTVSSISTDTFTIVRAQESSSARTVVVGDQIALTVLSSIQPPGIIQPYAARIAPIGWLNCDGSTVSRTTYAPLFSAIVPSLGSVTCTSASPAVVTNTAHGLSTGDAIFLTGTAPTGTSINTLYYIIRIDANSYNIATSRANAYAGTKINTTSTGSSLVAWDCPHGLGDGSTTFTLPDIRGRGLAGMDTTGGTAAGRLNLAQSQGVYGNLGATGGEQGHTMTTSEMVAHTHNMTYPANGTAGGFANLFAGNNTGTNTTASSSTGSTTAFNNIAPIGLVNYIIKT